MTKARKAYIEKYHVSSLRVGAEWTYELAIYTQPRWDRIKGRLFHNIVDRAFYRFLPWKKLDAFAIKRHAKRCTCDDFCQFIPPSNSIDLRCDYISHRNRVYVKQRIRVDRETFDKIKENSFA